MRPALILFALLMWPAAALANTGVCTRIAAQLEPVYDIPPFLLQAIVLTESAGNPLALNIDGKGFFPASYDEAVRMINQDRGQYADIGCGQISMRHHRAFFGNRPELALDPLYNLIYAAKFLSDTHRRVGSWPLAVAHYHSSDPTRQQVYVCRIIDKFSRLTRQPPSPLC